MSGAPGQVVDVMTEFGELIGVAFQLADDVLDVSSESSDSGKTPGTDLREGVRTLPVLHALRSTDPHDVELVGLLTGDLSDDVRLGRALDLLRASDAMKVRAPTWSSMPRPPAPRWRPFPQVRPRPLESLCDVVISRSS